jgi:hypothetical protein
LEQTWLVNSFELDAFNIVEGTRKFIYERLQNISELIQTPEPIEWWF